MIHRDLTLQFRMWLAEQDNGQGQKLGVDGAIRIIENPGLPSLPTTLGYKKEGENDSGDGKSGGNRSDFD